MQRYAAFISYSHEDSAIAKTIQRRLETFVLPASLRNAVNGTRLSRRPLRPVYRDVDEMVPGGHLSQRVADALEATAFLVVIASRSSAQSLWVDYEVRRFIELGRRSQIIVLVVDGMPNAVVRGSAAIEECLPPALVNHSATSTVTLDEPLWVDWRRTGRFDRRKLMHLAAALLSFESIDNLIQRDRRRRRVVLGLRVCASLIVAALLAGFIILQRNIVSSEVEAVAFLARDASAKAHWASAQRFALTARNIEALSFLPFHARDVDVQLVRSAATPISMRILRPPNPSGIQYMAVSPDGQTIVFAPPLGGKVIFIDFATGRSKAEVDVPGPMGGLAFANDNKNVVVVNWEGRVGLVAIDHAYLPIGQFPKDPAGGVGVRIDSLNAAEIAVVTLADIDGTSQVLRCRVDQQRCTSEILAGLYGGGISARPSGEHLLEDRDSSGVQPLSFVDISDSVHRLVHTPVRETLGSQRGDVLFNRDFIVRWVSNLYPNKGPSTFTIYSRANGDLLQRFEIDETVEVAALSPIGWTIAAGLANGDIELHNISEATSARYAGHSGGVSTLAFVQAGNSLRLVSAALDGSMKDWAIVSDDPNNYPIVSSLNSWKLPPPELNPTASADDGGLFLTAITNDGGLLLRANLNKSSLPMQFVSPQTRQVVRTLPPPPEDVHEVVVSRDGKRIMLSYARGVQVINGLTGAVLKEWRGDSAHLGNSVGPAEVAMSEDGSRVAFGRWGVAEAWDMTSDKSLLRVDITYEFMHGELPSHLTGLAFSPSGGELAVGTTRTISVFDIDLRSKESAAELPPNTNVSHIQFAADGDRIAFRQSNGMHGYVWLRRDGGPVVELRGHGEQFTALGISPDGRYGVTAGAYGEALLWDVDTQQIIDKGRMPREATSIRFLKDRAFIASKTRFAEWLTPTVDVAQGRRVERYLCGELLANGLDRPTDVEGEAIKRVASLVQNPACQRPRLWDRLASVVFHY